MVAPTPFKKPPAPPGKGEQDPDDPLLKEMNALLTRARTDRGRHQSRIADCYRYAMPWRHRFNQNQPANDIDQVFDSTVITVLEDFSADMLNTFTPQKNNWLEEQPVKTMDKGEFRQIAEMLLQRQAVIFSEMARSSLYQALQEAYMDLGPGTMALLIKDIGATRPFHCEAIPSTDLLITRGPYGLVDGIFRDKRKRLRSEIMELWPDADLSLLGPEPQDPTNQEYEVTDGCWRDWSNKGDEAYHYVVESSGKIIYRREWKGPGSCPFIVARWGRDSTTAWGVGPTYRTLPDIKTLNHLRYTDLKNYDKHVDPPTSYEDDGVMNLDQGINPGDWIPRAVGSKEPKAIESQARLDLTVFERDELRSTVRRAHYQDRPEQLGKTPPSATQWADERAERARRMGTPATNLVQELQIPIYQRFSYLLEQRGTLPPVELNGEAVSLEPVSPLLRAQEQEEIVRMDKFIEMLGARLGPQLVPILIDVIPWVVSLAKKFGIDPKLIRDEAKMKTAMEQLMPILQNFAASRGIAAGAPPLGAISGGVPVQ